MSGGLKVLPAHYRHGSSIISSNTRRFGEELLFPLLPPICTYEQHPGTVDGKERTDAVEFACEDLKYDESEGELRERGAHVGAFEGALCGADLYELLLGEVDGAGPVKAQAILVLRMAALQQRLGVKTASRRPGRKGMQRTYCEHI